MAIVVSNSFVIALFYFSSKKSKKFNQEKVETASIKIKKELILCTVKHTTSTFSNFKYYRFATRPGKHFKT